jgi:hypothetical protein
LSRAKSICMLVFLVSMVSITFLSCASSGQKTPGISASAQLTAIYADPYAEPPNNLIVELKPTSSTGASKEYVLGIYEEGILRDSTIFTWSQAEINVQSSLDVRFALNDQELHAYGQIIGGSKNTAGTRDLRDIFTIAIAEPTAVESIFTRPSIHMTAPNQFDVVVGLVPNESTQPLTIYVVKLVWKTDTGYRKSLSGTVSWSQSQLESRQVRNVGLGTFSEQEATSFIGGGSEDFWQKHYYRVTVLPREFT